MTRIEFYFNIDNKVAKAAELCEKSLAKGRQVTVFSPDEQISSTMQTQLWAHAATSFLPSHTADHPNCAHAPIQIHNAQNNVLQDDILINFDAQVPLVFGRFQTLIELVSHDEADKVEARARFKFYRDRGYEINATNLADN